MEEQDEPLGLEEKVSGEKLVEANSALDEDNDVVARFVVFDALGLEGRDTSAV
jgi:hypothetical protein